MKARVFHLGWVALRARSTKNLTARLENKASCRGMQTTKCLGGGKMIDSLLYESLLMTVSG